MTLVPGSWPFTLPPLATKTFSQWPPIECDTMQRWCRAMSTLPPLISVGSCDILTKMSPSSIAPQSSGGGGSASLVWVCSMGVVSEADNDVGVLSATYFSPGLVTNLDLCGVIVECTMPPYILNNFLLAFCERLNPFISLLPAGLSESHATIFDFVWAELPRKSCHWTGLGVGGLNGGVLCEKLRSEEHIR
ncbi:hypothetical protein K439DRAFT_1660553 [Ramaria rubella]|nr:hypothetical protein K439DRAFT_1660553 [Ramaria rubella]